jgi:chromate transporter
MKELLDLYFTFFKIGSCTFGGGYAMLPIIQREIVEKRRWATEEEIADYYAIGQCTPGIIAINTATFIGFKRKSIAGGIIATLGFVTPAIIIISVIAALLSNFADIPVVKNAFAGIRVCVCVLIFNAILNLWKNSVPDLPSFIIFLAVLLLSIIFSASPALMVIAAGIAGVIINVVRNRHAADSIISDKSKQDRGDE